MEIFNKVAFMDWITKKNNLDEYTIKLINNLITYTLINTGTKECFNSTISMIIPDIITEELNMFWE